MARAATPDRRRELVDAAIGLLDDEGLDGLSMRRLAERTEVSTTAAYWHFEGKADLIAQTLDTVIAEIDLPDIDAVGWREAAAAMARGFRAMMLRHPWLALVAATYPNVHGPQLARHNEHVIAVYEAAGFEGEEAMHAEATVYAFALGTAAGEAGTRAWRSDAAGATPDDDERSRREAEEAVRDHPRLAARLAQLDGADPARLGEESFEFGLAVVLDGLEARRPRRRRP